MNTTSLESGSGGRSSILILTVLLVTAAGLTIHFRGKAAANQNGKGDPASKPSDPRPAEKAPVVARGAKLRVEYLAKGLPDKGQWRGKPALADLDRDGHLDLVASIRRWDSKTSGEGLYVWLGNGAGTWTPMVEGLRRDMGYGGSCIGDIDGDGRLDIAFSGHDVTPHVFLNMLKVDGQSSWVPSAKGIDTNTICADVALGDFDGDGKLDLAAIGQFPSRGGLAVYRGDGEGGFELTTELFDKKHYGNRVIFTDLDQDGHVELFAATDLGPKVWKYSTEKKEWLDLSAGIPGSSIFGSDVALQIANFDGGKFPQLIAAGFTFEDSKNNEQHPSLRAFRWDGKAWSLMASVPIDVPAYFDVTLVRVAKETTPLIATAAKDAIDIYRLTKDGFRLVGQLADSAGALSLAAGDVDGDGTDELVVAGFTGIKVVKLLEVGKRD